MEVLEADAARTSLLLMFISLGCILGSASFGRISDRIGSLQALVISTLFLSVSWLLLLMSGPKSAGWLPVTASVLLGVFGAGGFAAGFSCIRLFTSSQTTGQVTGLCNCAAFLGSTFFTQIIGFGMDTAVILPAVPYYRFVIASFAGVSLLASGPVLVVFRKRRETKRE